MANAITIDYYGIRPYSKVLEAITQANELLRNDEFYDRIAAHTRFTLASISPEAIAHLMYKSRLNMTLDLYYAFNPKKNIDGYDDLEDPTAIHMNIWKIDRSVESLCNTLIHACVHAVNAEHKQFSFGHGAMSFPEREHTAPYAIGGIAQKMISGDDTVIVPLEHDAFEPDKKTIKNAFINCVNNI